MDRSFISSLQPWINPRGRRFWTITLLLTYTLAGFFLVPALIKQQLPRIVSDTAAASASVKEVRFNPWTLRLQANGFSLRDEEDGDVFSFEEAVVNLQVRSLVRFALVFREVSLTKPTIHLERYKFADTNIGRILDSIEPAPEQPEETSDAENSSILRLVIDELHINDAAVHLQDNMPDTPFNTRLEPIDINLTNFSTLPDRTGAQQIQVNTETGSTLVWSGYLQVSPLVSAGKIKVSGSPLQLLERYFQDQLNFDADDCCLDIALQYVVASTPDGDISAHISGFNLSSRELVASTLDTEERVLQLNEFRITEGELYWPEQQIKVQEVLLAQPEINLWLEADGTPGVLKLMPAAEDSAAEADAPEASADATVESSGTVIAPGWDIQLDELRVADMGLEFTDRSLPDPETIRIDNIDFSLREISNTESAEFPFKLDAQTIQEGHIAAEGTLQVSPALYAKSNLTIERLPISLAQPWVSTATRINIGGGTLNLTMAASSSPDETLDLQGDIRLAGLRTTDGVLNEPLLGWKSLDLAGTHLQLDAGRLGIGSIELNQPTAKLHIDENGESNFAALVVEEDSGNSSSSANESGAASSPMVIRVDSTTVRDGAVDFSDLSLPLPFAAPISDLQGGLSALASDSKQASEISLEGDIGQFGFVSVTGTASIMDPLRQTEALATFRNVGMPSLSPYTAEFAGRKIASGVLDLDLTYAFDEAQMTGANKITIKDFSLGEAVENPDAMELPLDIAVALLKDMNGVIDLELDVSGDVNDPEFSASGIVLKALANLITKAAAAPFKLLGGLVPGGGDADLENIEFQEGSAELMPQERQKLQQLSQALLQRPSLVLQVPAGYNEESDTPALQKTLVDQQVAGIVGPDTPPEKEAKSSLKALEKLTREQLEDVSLRALRKEFKREPEGGGRARLDEVAYAAELNARLAAAQVVGETELLELARQRQAAVADTLKSVEGQEENQIQLTDPAEFDTEDNGWVRVKLGLEMQD